MAYIDDIVKLASEGGITLTDTDRDLIAVMLRQRDVIRNLPETAKKAMHIPVNETPDLNVGWEMEFFLKDRRTGRYVQDDARCMYVLEELQATLGCVEKAYLPGQTVTKERGQKCEVSNKFTRIGQSLVDYFNVRKTLKEICARHHMEVEKFSMHAHFSLCGQDGKVIPGTHSNNDFNKFISYNVLELMCDCLPMLASQKQIEGVSKPQSRHLEWGQHYDYYNRDYALRTVNDNFYSGKVGDLHHELRRMAPGKDNQKAKGFDALVAGMAVISGGVAAALSGRYPKIITGEDGLDHKSYQDRCEEMQASEFARSVFGQELLDKMAGHMLSNIQSGMSLT